jgi:catechol 2,3-dioxygenase-like lactoylglutathione lyase family enzyme
MSVTFKRLDHVQVCYPAGEEARVREFYGRLLGLREVDKPEALKGRGGIWYEIADIQLHLGVEDASLAPSPKRHPAFEVERIAEIRAYLEEAGVPLRDEVMVPGLERFSFFDPFGNRFELLEKKD